MNKTCVPSIALSLTFAMLGFISICQAWDQAAAIQYGRQYCALYNSEYHDYDAEGGDCANFLSQILTYGCQNLCESPYWWRCSSNIDWDENYCQESGEGFTHYTIIIANHMRLHLMGTNVYYQLVRDTQNDRDYFEGTNNLQSWIGAGYIFLMGTANGAGHCLFGTSSNGSSTYIVSHSADRCGEITNDNLSSYWGRYGPDGHDERWDRFWIFQVIASPQEENESQNIGGTK